MKDVSTPMMIDAELLRVGMFVQLEGGWMSHPFPLSSFKISTPEQIATIRGLGKPRVRWVPEKSDVQLLPEAPILAVVEPTPQPTVPQETPEAAALRQRREALAAQRAALQLCERQFAEAATECRKANDNIISQPQKAREQTTALVHALVTKLIGKEEMCIRLLTDAAGDRASMHSMNVSIISLLMARTFGLAEADLLDIGVGAMLHDMGKLQLPEHVRHRDDGFSQGERELYQSHVALGVAMARKMNLTPGAIGLIEQHHEHADGSGFPFRLNSDRMTTAARIVALINRYDNLCNPHVPSRAITPHEALAQLFSQGKTRYDTAILGAFIRMMGVYPPGSTVQLTDDRYAMVVSVNSSRPLKPKVLVHDAKVPREEALTLDLEADGCLGIRRSLKPQQLPPASIAYLSPRARVAYFFEPNSVVHEVCA